MFRKIVRMMCRTRKHEKKQGGDSVNIWPNEKPTTLKEEHIAPRSWTKTFQHQVGCYIHSSYLTIWVCKFGRNTCSIQHHIYVVRGPWLFQKEVHQKIHVRKLQWGKNAWKQYCGVGVTLYTADATKTTVKLVKQVYSFNTCFDDVNLCLLRGS